MSSSYGAVHSPPCHAPGDDEEKRFPTDLNDSQLNSSAKRWGAVLPRAVGVISLIIALSGLAVMADVWRDLKNTASNTGYLAKTDSTKLYVTSVANEYGIWDSSAMLPYPFFVGSLFVEPYKETTIALTDPTVGCAYDWSMTKKKTGLVDSSGVSADGTIVVTLKTVGEYVIAVSESCGDTSSSARQLSQTVWVKYVRRELSTLTDNDRTAFLDAFHTLWTVSTTEGQALYGDRYKSVNYFATLHNDGGGNNACDEFHGGLGFLNNHMYLSAYLEQSLQLVDPSVALHYMEYTKYFESDGYTKHLGNQLDGGSWTDLLTSKYFGASDPTTGRIIDGRWANAEVPYMTKEFFAAEGIDPDHTFFPAEENEWLTKSGPHINSPYGLLRSPWNYNPSPYVTRYGSVFGINDTDTIVDRNLVFKYHLGVHCIDYVNFFKKMKNQPLETYLTAIEDDTHGIFHFTLGGVGGEQAVSSINTLINTYGFSMSNIGALSVSAQPFFKKNLAGKSSINPINCSSNPWENDMLMTTAMPGKENGPQCAFKDAYYETTDTLDTLVEYFFTVDPDFHDSVKNHLSSLDFEDRKGVMVTISSLFPFDGDLAGAGAALDPLFWVAHGALERTFQKSVFSGIFSDMIYSNTGHCSGHTSSSTKAWLTGLYFTDETVLMETLTNADLTAVLDPTSDHYRDYINFVYDTASFDWCANSDAWFE